MMWDVWVCQSGELFLLGKNQSIGNAVSLMEGHAAVYPDVKLRFLVIPMGDKP
jgi:hypothetical protein